MVIARLALPLLLSLLSIQIAAGQPLGSAFTYQGRLTEAGQAASGLYDLQLCLFDAPTAPAPLACAPDFADVPVEGGVFTLAVDFGAAVFIGQQRFLELRVRPGASTGAYTPLAPRQVVRPAPEALRASAASSSPWSGLTGVPTGFADGIDNDSGGTVTSVTAGAGLSGGTITAGGTIGIANGGVGLAQINTAQVQARIATGCAVGQYVRAVAADGSVTCGTDAAGGTGTVTSIVAGTGLSGGTITGSGTIGIADGGVGLAQINTSQVQARIGGTCPIGRYFRGVRADGSLACEPVPGVPVSTTIANGALLDNFPLPGWASIAIGPAGTPAIALLDPADGAVRLLRCRDGACTDRTSLTVAARTSTRENGFANVAFGADGVPVIAWRDSTPALRFARCTNPDCTAISASIIVDADNSAIDQVPAVAIGLDGIPVFGHQGAFGRIKFARCRSATCGDGVDARILVFANAPGLLQFQSGFAVPPDGRPVAAYMRDGGSGVGSIELARCADAACTGDPGLTSLTDVGVGVYWLPSLAIGSDGFPTLVASRIDGAGILVVKCLDAACATRSARTFPAPAGNYIYAGPIRVGADGIPVLAWGAGFDRPSQRDTTVVVARCDDGQCQSGLSAATVDSTLRTSSLLVSSMAIGTDALPLLASIDDGDRVDGTVRVRLLKCGSRSCR